MTQIIISFCVLNVQHIDQKRKLPLCGYFFYLRMFLKIYPQGIGNIINALSSLQVRSFSGQIRWIEYLHCLNLFKEMENRRFRHYRVQQSVVPTVKGKILPLCKN